MIRIIPQMIRIIPQNHIKLYGSQSFANSATHFHFDFPSWNFYDPIFECILVADLRMACLSFLQSTHLDFRNGKADCLKTRTTM